MTEILENLMHVGIKITSDYKNKFTFLVKGDKFSKNSFDSAKSKTISTTYRTRTIIYFKN